MPTYVEILDAEIDGESPVTVSLVTRLRDNALAYAGAPTGTRATWQQTSAPLGWTKESSSTYNNASPRIVTGSAGTGGSVDFSTLYARTATDSFSIAQANLPSGVLPGSSVAVNQSGPITVPNTGASATSVSTGFGVNVFETNKFAPLTDTFVNLGGSGTQLSAGIDMRVKFVDHIIAMKD